jgi:thioesterase domain-containing protein
LTASIYNMYGPTETAMEATYARCAVGRPVSIGTAIPHMRVHLLDDAGQPVPNGVDGELCLAGPGLARGYLNDPGLTAQRFVAEPNPPEPGARMYRTGDICCRQPDGTLQYRGRRDRQVKINGQRIELGEIEAALHRLAGVREAAVTLREDRPGTRRLVGYVALRPEPTTTVDALRRELGDRLPRHLVPAALVLVDQIPRTATGKPDRRRLPAPPGHAAKDTNGGHRDDPLRDILLDLWRGVLGVENVTGQDHFFDAGGTSIHAAILTHRLEDLLHEPVYSVAVHDAPTPDALSDYLRRNYRRGVERVVGAGAARVPEHRSTPDDTVDSTDLHRLRQLIRTRPVRSDPPHSTKNPPAVFVLSPPRSGSTLLRVMLGAHPGLFAPPELQLLNYDTLQDRRAALASARDNFWLQGTVRALMEIMRCDADAAAAAMESCEDEDMSVKNFYRSMQDRLGGILLVDKTPNYALDLATLARAEEYFTDARYVHLIRHPAAVVRSFEEAKLQVFFPPFLTGPHPYSPAQLAELIWNLSHRNIQEFLAGVPEHRKHAVTYERLVGDPQATMMELCTFLDLPFDPRTVDPYREDQRALMTDPVRPMARMLGDVKFHRHGRIRAEAATPHPTPGARPRLGTMTGDLATGFGYRMYADRPTALVALQAEGDRVPVYLVHPAAGTVSCYRDLARRIGARQPCYAFRAPAVEGAGPWPTSVPEIASRYLDELRRHQPDGPYRLGGWSFGGIVAVEMALKLTRSGAEVEAPILVDSYLLAANGAHPPRQYLDAFLREHHLEVPPPDVADRLAYTFDRSRHAGILPTGTTMHEFAALVRRRDRVYRHHIDAARRYRPEGRLPRVVLFEARDRGPSVEGTAGAAPSYRCWSGVADELVRLSLPGDHFSILLGPGVDPLADAMLAELRDHWAPSRQ